MSSVFEGGLKRLILLFAMKKHRRQINLQSRGNGVAVMIVLIDVLSRDSVFLWSLLYFAFARFLALCVSFGRPVFFGYNHPLLLTNIGLSHR